VAAGGGIAVLVPEEDAEIGAAVVRWNDEPAVHVCVPARLVAQQPTHPLHVLRRARVLAPGEDGRPRNLDASLGDDAERLTCRVVVRRRDLHRAQYLSGRVA
jgi:hypothetical protein